MKKKSVLKWVLGVIAALLMVLAAGGWWLFGILIAAANSIEKLEDGLFFMEYAGDYGFDDFLAQGGAVSDGEVASYLVRFLSRGFYKLESDVETGDFGCSTICTRDENGTTFFGRNYDWAQCRAIIVHTKPQNGYESVSTCCLDFLGFREDYSPDGSMMERMQSLAAIYVPLDGMNEEGLAVADLIAGDKEATHQNTGKPDLTTTTAIRLLLDKAANVDEAIREQAKDAHFYVACDGDRVIACGGITGYWGSKTESYLVTIFVLPGYQGSGVGRKIVETLEADEYFRRAWRTEVGSSLTAVRFYEKMGYAFKNGVTAPDKEGVVRMEKRMGV